MPDVLQIDLTKIDIEIQHLEAQFIEIKKRLDDKRRLREYLLEASKDYSVTSSNEISLNDKGQFEISEFLLNYLKENGEAYTSDIIQAFADVTKKPFDLSRSNVSNALTRLKSNKKVDNKKDKEGRGVWFLK